MLSYALIAVGQDISPVISMRCCVASVLFVVVEMLVVRVWRNGPGAAGAQCLAMCYLRAECCVLAKERGWRV
jgi:hypothetical protein